MTPSPLPQAKLDREQDPCGHRLVASPCGIETPAAHGLGGGLVEVGVTGGLLDDDSTDAPVGENLHLEHRSALHTELPSGRGIARPHLIAALGPRVLGDGPRR